MRLAFSAPAAPGHLNPMTALARRMKQRGHDVFFLEVPDARPMVEAAGIDFVPYCEQTIPAGELPRRLNILGQLSGSAAVRYTVEIFTDECRAALEDGERALREASPDALVLDISQRGLNLVAMHMGIPFVQVANALHYDFSGHTPLCVYDWPHQEGASGFSRNQLGNAQFGMMMGPLLQVQQEYATRVGLQLDWKEPTAGQSHLAQLTQTPKEFDFPANHWPKYFHHVGPLHDPQSRPQVDFPWDRLTGEPLIYASMGTLQNGSESIFRIIAEAVAAPGRQVVLAIGNSLDPAAIQTSGNTIVMKQTPQLDLMKRASLCVTHAGLNTVLEALAQGVPMVAIPVTNDQPGVGARIAYTGTGVVVPFKHLSVPRLRAAVDKVLADARYAENARRLQAAIQRTNGLETAADLIEAALGDSHS